MSKSEVSGLLNPFLLLLDTCVFPLCPDQAVRNVLEDGSVEEDWLLLDEAHVGAKPVEIERIDCSTI